MNKETELLINTLKAAVTALPELRLGQIISNSIAQWNVGNGTQNFLYEGNPDPYHVPNEMLATMVRHYIAVAAQGCAECGGTAGQHFLSCSLWPHNQKGDK